MSEGVTVGWVGNADESADKSADDTADNSAEPLPEWLSLIVRASEVAAPLPPGPSGAQLQWFSPPEDASARDAAVLIAFCATEAGPGVLLTERAVGMRNHSGQAAFPGGASEPADLDAPATALREAAEEVGLDPTSVRILITLEPRFLPPSGFLVTPVLGWWLRPHPIAAINAGEVARAVVVTLADLADPANRFHVIRPRTGFAGPGFEIDELFIWGFTAVLLDQLLRAGGWEQPWDTTNIRPLPDRLNP